MKLGLYSTKRKALVENFNFFISSKMKKDLFLLLATSLSLMYSCTQKRAIKSCETFVELTDPTNDTLSVWDNVEPHQLHVSYVSIDEKYAKSRNPELSSITTKEHLVAWKGEKVSTQVLLWTSSDVNQVEFESSDLATINSKIDKNAIDIRFVRYVMTDVFPPGCGYRKPEDFPSSLAPDMLDNIDCINIEGKTVRPVWVTVNVPSTAKAGIYKGELKIFARDLPTQKLDLEIEVLEQTLPAPKDWKFHLDLWQHPSSVARVHSLKVWSDEHYEKMIPIYTMLANAGQKVITATLNKDPWNNQCFDAYESMILWTKHKDGSWSYDFTEFDKWVNFMTDLGIDKLINCYSMVPWNNELVYFDEVQDKEITLKADPGTQIFDEMWGAFLPQFTAHLKEKGWLDKTNIAMDERSEKEMNAMLETLNKYAPELGVSLADNHKSYKKYPNLTDICVEVGACLTTEEKDKEARREKGYITTYYTSCADEFPNMFTFSDSGESAYVGWLAEAAGLDGFLRWAYNSWVENPLQDSRFRTWPAGDTYQVYPDARSSIRFERLVEGIQDYEKIKIIKEKMIAKNDAESKADLETFNEAIAKLKVVKRHDTWNKDLNDAKKLLQELSKKY